MGRKAEETGRPSDAAIRDQLECVLASDHFRHQAAKNQVPALHRRNHAGRQGGDAQGLHHRRRGAWPPGQRSIRRPTRSCGSRPGGCGVRWRATIKARAPAIRLLIELPPVGYVPTFRRRPESACADRRIPGRTMAGRADRGCTQQQDRGVLDSWPALGCSPFWRCCSISTIHSTADRTTVCTTCGSGRNLRLRNRSRGLATAIFRSYRSNRSGTRRLPRAAGRDR